MSDINYWISDKLQEVFNHLFLNLNFFLSLFVLMHELVLTTTDFRGK